MLQLSVLYILLGGFVVYIVALDLGSVVVGKPCPKILWVSSFRKLTLKNVCMRAFRTTVQCELKHYIVLHETI